MKILIVDDNLVVRKSLQKLLASLADCEIAADGRSALTAAICDTPPDLILLDIIMPEMNGHEVLHSLKAAQQTKDVPVIFISAMDDKEDVIKGLEMGAVDYIIKPFHKAEVVARVQTHLALKMAQVELEKTIKALRESFDEIKTLRGIIPICAYCKKIRNDKGAWDIVEAYICDHTDAEFSHGICPDCYKKEMADLAKDD